MGGRVFKWRNQRVLGTHSVKTSNKSKKYLSELPFSHHMSKSQKNGTEAVHKKGT